MKNYITIILCSVLLASCNTKYTPHNPPASTGATLDVQQKAMLAFVSYAGDDLKDTDQRVDETLQACIAWELTRQPILENRFTLAWGPSVHRFELAELDDNMMYAAWDEHNQGELVIGIRGTNPKSISDWFVEDFFVTESVAWPYAKSENTNARITKATNIGLSVLQALKGANHALDTSSSILLEDFLLENAHSGKLKKITVTGHSLAGALAPVFALWLKDKVFADQSLDVAIDVLPIAGATPGNAEFANYYDQRLGENTNRLHNPFDAVPHSWSIHTMRALPSIFYTDDYFIQPTKLELGAFDLGIELAKAKGYTHVNSNQASTGGKISELACMQTFATQAGWQHHCGYYEALGMTKDKDKPILNTNSKCLTEAYCNNPENRDSPDCQLLFEPFNCTTCTTDKKV